MSLRQTAGTVLLLASLWACSPAEVQEGGSDAPAEQPERSDTESTEGNGGDTDTAEPDQGRLSARPPRAVSGQVEIGLQPLGLGGERDGLLYIPESYDGRLPAPFALTLHGAGSCAERGLRPLIPFADEHGMILLAPESRGSTWDVILGGFGPDVEFIDRALKEVFSRYKVNPDRLAIEGFSDGASYALSLGTTNGDLFSHVIAFSPGFMRPGELQGKPPIFISHGTEDGILPIDVTSRKIVPLLKDQGYEVDYTEFPGRHIAAPLMARRALSWFLETKVGAGDPAQTTGDEPC